jgi:pantoate--beta-alanine ligase
MRVFTKIAELVAELDIARNNGLSIGFVPTMGALHQGHLSLINEAAKENNLVVISIFVNPTQFNNSDDLKKYPRNLEKDTELLKNTKCSFIFAPSEKDIYPNEVSRNSNYQLGRITEVLEGKFRPGHFEGVATVVSRLFEIVKPSRAYFGQKDLQQFLIISRLNSIYLKHLKIELVKCPIIREADGLAMSSRNLLLDDEKRKSATIISQTLRRAQTNYKSFSVTELKKWVIESINKDTNLKVEYFELVNDPDLEEILEWDMNKKIVACVAVFAGEIRLIDNVYFN